MIHTSDLNIRALCESDYPIMAKWLNDDLVLEYYGPRLSLEQVRTKYDPRVKGEHYVKSFIVEYQNKQIGYMQYYRIPKEQLKIYGYRLGESSIYGIDQFIGDPGLWGKGLGTLMISGLLKYLSSKLGVSNIALDVKSTNFQAIKCYEKCGFRVVKDLEDNHLLMEWVKY